MPAALRPVTLDAEKHKQGRHGFIESVAGLAFGALSDVTYPGGVSRGPKTKNPGHLVRVRYPNLLSTKPQRFILMTINGYSLLTLSIGFRNHYLIELL